MNVREYRLYIWDNAETSWHIHIARRSGKGWENPKEIKRKEIRVVDTSLSCLLTTTKKLITEFEKDLCKE